VEKRRFRAGYDVFGKISPYASESETDASDADESTDKEAADDSGSAGDDDTTNAWKSIAEEALDRVKESVPDCTVDNWLEEPCFTNHTLPSLSKCLQDHIDLVSTIKKSSLFAELQKTSDRLKKQGLPIWEKNLKVMEDRKHLVKARLADILNKDGSDVEDSEDSGDE
jgi:hypothetical protein